MKYKVSFTHPAEEDLLSTLQYITDILQSPIAASNLLDDVEEKIKILANNPLISPIEKDDYLNQKSIRHMKVKNYLIFYTINDELKEVSVIRFMYARRDWINLVFEE